MAHRSNSPTPARLGLKAHPSCADWYLVCISGRGTLGPETVVASTSSTSHPTGDHWIAPRERSLFLAPPQPPPVDDPVRVVRHDEDEDEGERDPYAQVVRQQVRLQGYAMLRDLAMD